LNDMLCLLSIPPIDADFMPSFWDSLPVPFSPTVHSIFLLAYFGNSF